MMSEHEVIFAELRDDWYRGADLMARLIDRSSQGAPMLTGFPAQWIPVFDHFGAVWRAPIAPPSFVPIISDVSLDELRQLVASARQHGRLRVLVEGVASFDPLVADVLHVLDRRVGQRSPLVAQNVQFTGWQSYGRPEILDFNCRVLDAAVASATTAVVLPCARGRPYQKSRTHNRLRRGLQSIVTEPFDEIVISSLGVIPSVFWEDPIVLAYDSGVPDIYRVLRLMRAFFARARYETVIDCLEFEPYRDCLNIIRGEGLIASIKVGPKRRIKKLPEP